MRRIILVYLAFKLNSHSYFQFQALVLLNMLVVIYSGIWRPLGTRLANRMNLFNEGMIMFISSLLACFTDAVRDELTKYKYGWAVISLIIFTMAVNLIVFFKISSKILYLIGVKLYKRAKDRWNKKFGKKEKHPIQKIVLESPEKIKPQILVEVTNPVERPTDDLASYMGKEQARIEIK